MNRLSRYYPPERYVFFAMVLLALSPIWLSGKYFLTGDGPCHSYNASVLLQWLKGQNSDFFARFYTINAHFEPNWWTHAWLMLLQTIFSPAVAEKLFLSMYVLGFAFGMRFLLRQINENSVFLSSAGLLFCWHHLLQMGFFNYSWSLSGMFWVVGYWLYCRSRPTIRQGLILAFCWVALYSMHPIGLTFAGIAMGFSLLAEAVTMSRVDNFKTVARHLLVRMRFGSLSALPALLLAGNYLLRKNWHKGENTESFSGIIDGLASLSMLVTMNMREHPVKNFVALLMVGIVVAALWLRFQKRGWQFGDFWLLFFATALSITLTQVGTQSLELLMPLRLQLLPWFGLLFWAAVANYGVVLRQVISAAAFILLSILVFMRLPAHQAASRLVEDWTSVAAQIADRSVLMVVNYNFNGSDENGKLIGDHIWMFNHAVDYIGAEHSGIIMSDNYEGLLGYFPLKWRLEGDMYNRTAIDGIGFENRPPRVDLLGFPKRSQGRQINYVLVLDQTESDRKHERGVELMAQLEAAYDQISTSPSGRAVLYQLRLRTN